MSLTKTRMTEDEFMRLPDDGRKYELVDGEAKELPAGEDHGDIGANVIGIMYPHVRGRGRLSNADTGFRMKNHNIRCPDVSFRLHTTRPGEQRNSGFGNRAPDLCIEIISPSEDRAVMQRKLHEYFDSGAQFVWHMFPNSQTIRVYSSPIESRNYGPDDEIDAGDLLPGFRCRVAELFEIE